MSNLRIEYIENGHRFTFLQEKANFFVQGILTVLTFLTLSLPVTALIIPNASKAMIIGGILGALIAVYLIRLLLWNLYGKEVFEISRNKVFHYTDYKLFKDSLFKEKRDKAVIFGYTNDLSLLKSDSETLDSPQNEKYIFTIANAEEVLTQSNIKLSKEEILQIMEVLSPEVD